jgi:hypothetical protein
VKEAEKVANVRLACATPPRFDEMTLVEDDDEYYRKLGIPVDAPKLPTLTVVNDVYDQFIKEIEAMPPRRRKNWRGNINFKTERVSLVWSDTYQRIHTKHNNFYVVKRAKFDEAMKCADLRVCTTNTGSAVAAESCMESTQTSDAAKSARDVMRHENASLLTGNHAAHTWKVKTPVPGTRLAL